MEQIEQKTGVREEVTSPKVTTEIPQVKAVEPKLPKGMTLEERKKLEVEADVAVKQLQALSGGQELEQADKVANVGLKAQRTAGTELDLLQERMSKLITDKDQNAVQLGQDIERLKETLNRINPDAVQKEFLFSLLSVVPFLGKRLIRALKTIDTRRQTVATFVEYIEKSLQKGRDMMVHDNAQLALLYKQLEVVQEAIRKNAYFAELLAQKLQQAVDQEQDQQKKARLQNVLFRVYVRAQDLRAMEEAYEQFFASITITRENNSLLIGSIERMLTLGMNVVTVALAINVALARQREVLLAVRATRDFIGNVLVQNANTIRQHVKEIGDIYKEPVIAVKRLEEAHTALLTAMEEIDKLKTEGIAAAKENIEKLTRMSEEIRQRRTGTQAAELVSIEAGELPVRPAGGAERPQI